MPSPKLRKQTLEWGRGISFYATTSQVLLLLPMLLLTALAARSNKKEQPDFRKAT